MGAIPIQGCEVPLTFSAWKDKNWGKESINNHGGKKLKKNKETIVLVLLIPLIYLLRDMICVSVNEWLLVMVEYGSVM